MLEQIFDGIDYEVILNRYNGDYSQIEYNSRKVIKNGIFVALEGVNTDGHRYIDSAVTNGAKLLIVSKDIECDYDINIVKVDDTRKVLGLIASNFYGGVEKKLKVIGITGTNGKTTTSYVLHKMLDKSAFIGSIGIIIGDEFYPPVNTTPESLDIIKYAKEAYEAGMKYLVLEVSSQGIDNHRVEGIEFDGAIFTNLSKEHLDYHKDMQEYFEVKRRLFEQLKSDGVGVTCIEGDYGRSLFEQGQAKISYGFDKGLYRGKVLAMDIDQMSVEIEGPNEKVEVKTKLIGDYNLLNILAAYAMVDGLGEDTSRISDNLLHLQGVEGRMEIIERDGLRVIVDYAHTEDALEKVLKSLSRCDYNKLSTLISGTGERYREKRPILAEIAGRYSDYVMVSSNSPRNENPMDIALEVAKGFEVIGFENFDIEVDRAKAIEKMIKLGRSGDIIILTGKGHERYQEVNGRKLKYKEVEVVKRALGIEE